ncbi:MAG TPA: lamin tail domain-containing protein [Dehalococcoidia bacterium]|nr:lamin tail domain-containing protein [Dehalococcoidia bacterium]
MVSARLVFVSSLVAILCAVGVYTVDVEGGADNVLTNPGFEQGLVGWEPLEGSLLLESSNVRSGVAAARLITPQVSPQRVTILQDGPAFAGDWDASVFMSSSVDGLLGELALEFYDTNNTRLTTSSATIAFPSVGYQELSLSLPAPEGTTSFRFLIIARGSPNSVALADDAFLSGVAGPPPTATETPTPPESPTPTPPDGGGDDDDDEDPELAASLYLRNPTFEIEEDGLSRHWRSEGGQVLYTTELARSGLAAGHMVGNLSTPITVSQTVRLLNENTRRFAVFALGSPPGGSVQLEIQWLLVADQPTAEPVRSEVMELDGIGYQEIALLATPPPRAAGAVLTITVINGAEGDNVRLDDASWRTSRTTTSEGPLDGDGPPSQGAPGTDHPSLPRPDDLESLVESTSGVKVTEVYYAAESGEAEWVELRNTGDIAVLIAGWVLFDNLGSVALDHTVITPDGYVLISSEGNLPSGIDSAILSPTGELGNGLANDGDHLILLDQTGALVDSLSWGDDQTIFDDKPPSASPGSSLSRLADQPDTDSSSDFRSASPTPGRGLAAFIGEDPDPSTPHGAEEEGSTDPESAAASGDDPSSKGIPGWLLMVLILAAVIACAGTVGWVRRAQLTEEFGRLRDRWWRF